MSAINLLPPSKAKRSAIKKAKQNTQQESDDLLAAFPLPRYFQIHFQHSHENIDVLKAEVAELKQTLVQLEKKIDSLIELLTQTPR